MSEWGEPGFETPEEAAASEIPPRYVRVLGVTYSADGDKATVDVLTNEPPRTYPLTVFCERDEFGRWHEAGSVS